MAYRPNEAEQLKSAINKSREQLTELRRQERQITKLENGGFSNDPEVASGFTSQNPLQTLKENLQKFLSPELMPGNIGGLNSVIWPFYYSVVIDFGDNPVIVPNMVARNQFVVSEEAGFLITSVERHSSNYSVAGRLGPWNVKFTDRQSNRQFNDTDTPIQQIGYRGRPTRFPVPMFLMPNAPFEVQMSTWIEPSDIGIGNGFQTQGCGKHKFVFKGVRIRVEDYENIASTVFG